MKIVAIHARGTNLTIAGIPEASPLRADHQN